MESTEKSIIRIPLTIGHTFWIGVWVFFAVGIATAGFMLDPLFLIGFLCLIIPGFLIFRWIGQSPGKIEFVSNHSYLVRSRREGFTWIYDGDNWLRNILPEITHLHLVDTGFRWSDERLQIITSNGAIFLGSGEKMLPIRDWLVLHGMQPK